MRQHVAGHILLDHLENACGYCGGQCLSKLIPTNKRKGVQYYKIDSECRYKIEFKKLPTMFSRRNKCTNILMKCRVCSHDIWKYALATHFSRVHTEHQLTAEEEVTEEETKFILKNFKL